MMWRTHIMGGLVSLWVLPLAIPLDSMTLAILFAVLGSLLPDLDARESKLSTIQIGGVAPIRLLAWLLNRSLGHRGPMHSLLAVLLIALCLGLPLALLLDPFAGIGLVLGYLSHLLLDACTRSGVPFYWPDAGRVWLVPPDFRITTGSLAEDALLVVLSFAASALLLIHLFQFQHATTLTTAF